MNKLILKRFRLSTDDERKKMEAAIDRGDSDGYELTKKNTTGEIRYEVKKVVGSVSPYVGETLSLDYVKDLCKQTGIWSITFI